VGDDDPDSAAETNRVQVAMKRYVSALPPSESETDLHGPVQRVDCQRWAMQFRGDEVWVCGVPHRTGTVAEWCGVLSGEELRTGREDPDVPCAAGHR
jgi:hypothetical protein